jgi:DNA end-binding protein Ku
MPASRPVWKGQLRPSLVSIPVELYTATKSDAKPGFRKIHEPSGKPVYYENAGYVLLTAAASDAVKLEIRKTLKLTFVSSNEVDPLYFGKPYCMVPSDDRADDAFVVIRYGLRQSDKIGLGQLAPRSKGYLVAIKPAGRGIVLKTLHYEAELRGADPCFVPHSRKKC